MKKIIFVLAAILLLPSVPLSEDKCTLSVAMTGTFRPHEFNDEKGNAKGYHVALVERIAKRLGCEPVITNNNWMDKIEGLKNGTFDMAIMPDPDQYGFKNEIVLHSVVHFWFVARSADTRDISRLVLSDNVTMLIERNSPVLPYINNHYPKADITFVDNGSICIGKLLKKEADVAVLPANFVLYNLGNKETDKIKIVDYPLYPTFFSLTFNDNNTELKNKIITVLEQMKESGEYSAVVGQYTIRNEPLPILKYLVWASLVFVAIMILVLLWTYSLRKIVKIRTSSLTDEIERRKETEQALASKTLLFSQLSNWFKAILESIPESLCLLNKEGNTLWSNIASSGKPLSTGQIKKLLNVEIAKAFEDEKAFNVTKVLDSGRTWDMRGIIVKNDTVPELFIMANDITEFVTLRDEAFMTSKLTTLGEMALGVAHEINNPIGIIQLNIQMLEEYCTDGDSKDMLTMIRDSARRIKKTVDDMKTYGSKSTEDYELIYISDCVRTAATLSGPLIEKSTNNFAIQTYPNELPVTGNRRQIEHVIINLIQNACNALAGRDNSIICSVSVTSDRSSVCFSIRDEGVGIPEELMGEVLKPFFTTKKDAGGTGLGLPIANRIIKEHNGSLEIDSKANVGTTVKFCIPVSGGAWA